MITRVELAYGKCEVKLQEKAGVYVPKPYALYLTEGQNELSLHFDNLDQVKDLAAKLFIQVAECEVSPITAKRQIRDAFKSAGRSGLICIDTMNDG